MWFRPCETHLFCFQVSLAGSEILFFLCRDQTRSWRDQTWIHLLPCIKQSILESGFVAHKSVSRKSSLPLRMLLSTKAATELLFKSEAVIGILHMFGGSITFHFWNIILNKELTILILCGDFKVLVCLYFHTSTSVSWSFILTLRRIIVQAVQEDNGHEVIESIMWPVAVQDQEQKTEQLFKEIVKVPEYRVKLWDFRRQ